jgi:hypothetical protein
MTTPASGAIALTDIQTEFGGTNPIAITEYYAGAGLVPAGTTGGNGSDGIASNTVIPSSGQIKFANFYNAAAVVIQSSMTLDGKTIDYSSGKKFEYYKTDVQDAAAFNITVTQDITATVTLTGGAGWSTATASGNGGSGGGGHTLIFTFTFKAGQTYVLDIGGVVQAGTVVISSAGKGGSYTALYLGSIASGNIIALAAGGGGGGRWSGGTTTSASNGGPGGSNSSVAVTNGLAWPGLSGGTGSGAGGGTGTAGGTPVGTTNPGTAGSFLTAGNGGGTGTYAGGAGGAGYYGGAGGQGGNSSSTVGGGGGGSSFAYTANDGSGKTVSNVSVITATRASTLQDLTGRAMTGIAGAAGTNSSAAVNYPFYTWINLGYWRRPYPGGSITTNFLDWNLVLQADLAPGATSMSLAYRVYTQSSRVAANTTLTWTNDPRRLLGANSVIEFTINGNTYTRQVSSSTGTTTTLTAALGVDVPSGTEIWIYPVNTNTSTTQGAFGVSTSFPTSNRTLFRVQQSDGTWMYGITSGGIYTGGTSSPIVVPFPAAIYPINTIPKGSLVQRSANNVTDTSASLTSSSPLGGAPGAVMIQFS